MTKPDNVQELIICIPTIGVIKFDAVGQSFAEVGDTLLKDGFLYGVDPVTHKKALFVAGHGTFVVCERVDENIMPVRSRIVSAGPGCQM